MMERGCRRGTLRGESVMGKLGGVRSAAGLGRVMFELRIGVGARATRVRASAASDVYKRKPILRSASAPGRLKTDNRGGPLRTVVTLSLIHISEPTSLGMISYAVFCLKNNYTLTFVPPSLFCHYRLDALRSSSPLLHHTRRYPT